MTRVAYVCADAGVPVMGSNGSSVHVQEMIRSLQHQGTRVELYAARVGGEPPPDLASTPLHQLPGLGGGDQAEREAAAMAANRAVRTLLGNAGLFDLVYERHSLFSYAAMEHARACDSASVLEVNAPLIDEQQRYRTLVHHDAATRAATRAFAAAGTIVAVSSEVAAYVRALGADPAKVHVLGNGVNPDRFRPGLPPSLPAPPGALTIGFVGSLKPWHGLDQLAAGFDVVRRLRPAARLLVVGDGPGRGLLEQRLQAGGHDTAVEWTGAVLPAAVPSLLASMDIAVAPYPPLADFYFSPLKLLEYMAAGLPVVASDIGQIRELISDGSSGLLYPPGDETALADCLCRLAADPELRRRLGREARRRVVKRHSWDSVAARVLALAARQPARFTEAAAS